MTQTTVTPLFGPGTTPPRLKPLPLPRHTKPPPPENTHGARTTVIQPSYGPNKYFIYICIYIYIYR